MRIVSYKFQINGEHSQLVEDKIWLRQGDLISPLLFVTVMEYLQRVLQNLKNKPNFNFHSKCEEMVIINISFVDDLLLFSRGDQKLVEMVMQAFEYFSKATRMKVNPSKCKLGMMEIMRSREFRKLPAS